MMLLLVARGFIGVQRHGLLHLRAARNSDPTAGAVVPSRSGCNVLKLERPFAFKAGRKPSSRQKGKQVTQPVENDPEEEGDDEPHKYLKYRASEITRDDIQFLTEDAENAAEDPGGCLIKYVSRQSALDNIVFEQVVADEAHNAKNPNGIYNHMLGLMKWRKILWQVIYILNLV
ncbi:hypothetical protein NXS19_008377 [Fusarium pseudograminearum]|nr:hypothetical protein NXS19_008377 [Fusarium pseudograminearum]